MIPRTVSLAVVAGALLAPLAFTAPVSSASGPELTTESFTATRGVLPPYDWILTTKVCNVGDTRASGATVSWTAQAMPGPLRQGAGNVRFVNTVGVPTLEAGKCADVATFYRSVGASLGEWQFTSTLNGDASELGNRAVREAANPSVLLGTGVGGYEPPS